jgi:membrane dipeptidase
VDYARPPTHEDALRETLAMASRLLRLERALDGELRTVRDSADLEASLDHGALAAVMHLEGAEPLSPDLAELDTLHAAGLRSLGLVWSRPNRFGHGTPFEFPGSPDQGPGLTDAGRALVRACNELNVLVDVSHLNEAGFWEVADLTDAPLVATHSNAHALCPSPRNLTDEQLRAIAERGGVAGLNFHVGFVRADGRDDRDTPLADLAAHAVHIAEVAGVDTLALGSDFDGGTTPTELDDASRLPALFDALRAAGFTEEDLEKVALGNWRRVLHETWGG